MAGLSQEKYEDTMKKLDLLKNALQNNMNSPEVIQAVRSGNVDCSGPHIDYGCFMKYVVRELPFEGDTPKNICYEEHYMYQDPTSNALVLNFTQNYNSEGVFNASGFLLPDFVRNTHVDMGILLVRCRVIGSLLLSIMGTDSYEYTPAFVSAFEWVKKRCYEQSLRSYGF